MVKIDHILERESMEFLKSHVANVDTKGVEVIVKTFKGKLVDTLELVCEAADIDLILIEPRTTSIKDEVFLGETSGKIINSGKAVTFATHTIVSENRIFLGNFFVFRPPCISGIDCNDDKEEAPLISLCFLLPVFPRPEGGACFFFLLVSPSALLVCL